MLVQLLYILGLVNLACGLFFRVSQPAQLAQPDLISHLPQSSLQVVKHVRALNLNQRNGVGWP